MQRQVWRWSLRCRGHHRMTQMPSEYGGGMRQHGAELTGLLVERAGDQVYPWGKVYLLFAEASESGFEDPRTP